MQVGRPVVRALRAAAFAAACILASALLHMLVGGGTIEPSVLAIAVVANWTFAYALGRRPRGRLTLLSMCGLSQYGMHQLFAAHEHASAALTPSAAAPVHGHGTGPGMLLIHVTVALVSSWWLAQGEATLCALPLLAAARTGLWWLRVLVFVPVAEPAVRVMPAWPQTARLVPPLLVRVLSRRGPPAFLPSR